MAKSNVVYVEGLPGSGKTTLLKRLSLIVPNLTVVSEYVNPTEADEAISEDDEGYFLANDERKWRTARVAGGACVVDRGHLSTVLYNKAHERIKGEHQVDVDTWYHGRILPTNMQPDAYGHLDTVPETPLRRRPTAGWDNMWDY